MTRMEAVAGISVIALVAEAAGEHRGRRPRDARTDSRLPRSERVGIPGGRFDPCSATSLSL